MTKSDGVTDCVILGAGLAGAATAYFLSRAGMRDIVVLDREAYAGFHSSGRNAAMLRQLVDDEALQPLTRLGARFIHSAEDQWDEGAVFRPSGSLFTASGARLEKLRKQAEIERARSGLEAEFWSAERTMREVGATRGASFEGAVHTPTDGTVDVHRMLHAFLRQARLLGARIHYAQPAQAIETDRLGRIAAVRTRDRRIATPRVVNAAGAWAGEVARLAGATPISIRAYRRHLVYTGAHDPKQSTWPCDSNWPYVWDLDADIYFRPESEGLLLSPCDEAEAPPGVPSTEATALDLLASKLQTTFPAIAGISIARSWAGLRSFAPDRRFVLGADPQVEGFYWAAALGGHGVTTSPAVGELVARAISGGAVAELAPFAPDAATRSARSAARAAHPAVAPLHP